MFGVQVKAADDVAGAFRMSVTVTVLVIPPPVTVIVALLVPIVAVAVFTLTFIFPLLEAEAGLTVSQLIFSLTVHDVLDVTARD